MTDGAASATATFTCMLLGAPQYPPKPRKSKGHLRVEHAEIQKKPTLLEFLGGGLQISMMVGS